MTKLAVQLKQGADHAWESLAQGWRDLIGRASGALTRLRPAAATDKSAAHDEGMPVTGGWAFMATDVFDADEKLVVRIEAPGMRREDFNVELRGDVLRVCGEKRFERESARGQYRVVQCAYGAFQREVPLPVAVKTDQTRASYRDGVLRIERPLVESARPRRVAVLST